MNVLIIAHFVDLPNEKGNNRFNYLAELLAKDNQVTVLTSSFDHTSKKQRELLVWDKIGYEIMICDEPHYHRNVCMKRFYSHYIFSRNVQSVLSNMAPPDIIYCAIPSLDVAVVAGRYAKKRRIPFILDIQDLWPEAFQMVFNPPFIKDLIYAPFAYRANQAYKLADGIVGVSETYVKRAMKVNLKAYNKCVYLGTDLGKFDSFLDVEFINKAEGEIWVVYAGTLGSSYNIEIVIKAIGMLPEEIRKKISFKVLGDGPYMGRFKAFSEKSGVMVEFLGRLSYKDMVVYLKKSDIAVNPICKGAAQSIINKHADYAAAGLPVINTQENKEYRMLIEKYKCGINCDVDSVKQVSNAIETLVLDECVRFEMGKGARKMAEDCFERENTYLDIIKIIEKVMQVHN